MNHETTVAFLEIARRYSCDERHITVLTGNDADFLDCVRCGCDGAIVATASVLPRRVCDIKEAFLSVNQGLAEQRQSLITQVRSLCRSVMPIMTHKKILEMVCGISMGPARFPHRELTETELKTISDKLHALHLML